MSRAFLGDELDYEQEVGEYSGRFVGSSPRGSRRTALRGWATLRTQVFEPSASSEGCGAGELPQLRSGAGAVLKLVSSTRRSRTVGQDKSYWASSGGGSPVRRVDTQRSRHDLIARAAMERWQRVQDSLQQERGEASPRRAGGEALHAGASIRDLISKKVVRGNSEEEEANHVRPMMRSGGLRLPDLVDQRRKGRTTAEDTRNNVGALLKLRHRKKVAQCRLDRSAIAEEEKQEKQEGLPSAKATLGRDDDGMAGSP